MASILNDRFELIEPLTVAPGDIARAAYKARETVSTASADDGAAGRVVVLRLLPLDEAGPALMEASDLAAKLKVHPNILAHYGITKIPAQDGMEGGIYAVSEYARGLTLRERIRRVAPFSLAVTLDIAISITKSLVYAHDRDVQHGDLRPEEILLTPEGQVRVSDFAVAKAVRQATGEEPSVYANDIRAVGLLLYEMLTGVAPDQMGTTGELSPKDINASIPPAVDGIVRKATSLSSGRQYPGAMALLTDLQTAREDLRTGKPLTWSPLVAAKAATPARPAPAAATGALSQAAEEIAAEDAGRRKGRAKQELKQEVDDDFADNGSPVFGRVMMGLLILLVILVGGACAYFATQLSVPNDVVVPNLIGKQFSDANKEATNEHLNLRQIGDDYSDTWPEGTIYQMSPPPGRTIKADKEIGVYVSDGPRLTDVPDLTQIPLDKAKRMLIAAGLPLGTVASDYSDVIPKGSVISQQPEASAKVSHSAPINVTISKGPAPPSAPEGLSASSTLNGEIDLSWGDVPDASTYNVYRDGKRIAAGLPQSAYSDTNLGDGETHSYTVTAVDTNGESEQSQSVSATTPAAAPPAPATPPTPPNVTAPAPIPAPPSPNGGALRQRDFHIRFRVPTHGADRHNVQIEVQDATGTNIFYDEDRDAGDTVDETVSAFGNKVIFRIFIDGKLVKQQVK